jgi:hypothetical protein
MSRASRSALDLMSVDTTRRFRLLVMIAGLALIMSLLACRGSESPPRRTSPASATPSPTPTGTPESQLTDAVESKLLERRLRFDHNRAEHKKQNCALCHQRSNNDPTPTFPGHAACVNCHGKEFPSPSSQMCGVCHETPMAQAKLIGFPKQQQQFRLKGFSHKDHLDPKKMPAGTELPKCDSCHRFDGRGIEASFPKHAECYSCHIHQAGEKLAGCQSCHAEPALALKYTPGVGPAFSQYNFKHGSHLRHASIQSRCERCHRLVEPTTDRTRPDILQISTARGQRHSSACWTCHVRAREPVCTKCHIGGPPL